jgi:hypothetical protein
MILIKRMLILGVLLVASWYAMQAVHELGHVLGALATGGEIKRVVLHPLEISRTDVLPNPRPLVVAWAGPLIGVALPVAIAAVSRVGHHALRQFADFFAGFCLIANGLYISVGSFQGIGDAGDLLRNGAPFWTLIGFGAASAGAGLWLWHCLTRR